MQIGIGLANRQEKALQKALSFNGTDEYLYKALPVNLLTGSQSTFADNNHGWTGYNISNPTAAGGVLPFTLAASGASGIRFNSIITGAIGTKYYVSCKMRCTAGIPTPLAMGNGNGGGITFTPTNQWSVFEGISTILQTGGTLFIYSGSSSNSSSYEIDDVVIKRDWKLDLNGTELIKHSVNTNAEIALNNVYRSNFATVDGWAVQTGGTEPVASGGTLTWTSASSGNNHIRRAYTFSANSYYIGEMRIRCVSGTSKTLTFGDGNSAIMASILPTSTFATYRWPMLRISGSASYIYLYFSDNTANGSVYEIEYLTMTEIPNMVSNSTFADNSWWVFEAGVAVSGGAAVYTNTANGYGFYKNNFGIISGKRYRISYTVLNRSTGGVRVRLGSALGTARTANGTYTDDVVATADNITFPCTEANTNLSIDNVHVYELPDWLPSGNHSIDVSIVDKLAGNASFTITASAAGDVSTNNVSLSAANLQGLTIPTKYTLEGFARATAANTRITAVLGSVSVQSAVLSTTSGTFTKFVLNFTASAAEVNATLKLYLNQADVVYLDALSLTPSYNLTLIVKTRTGAAVLKWILNTGGAGGVIPGYSMYCNTSYRAWIQDAGAAAAFDVFTSADNTWRCLTFTCNRVGNGIFYRDGIVKQTTAITQIGKILCGAALTVGAYNATTNLLIGQIGEIQIIRDFIPSAAEVAAFNTSPNFKASYGSGEVVGWWKLGSASNLTDLSGNGNDLTGVGIDSTNIVRHR
jgi:hypothetical protein